MIEDHTFWQRWQGLKSRAEWIYYLGIRPTWDEYSWDAFFWLIQSIRNNAWRADGPHIEAARHELDLAERLWDAPGPIINQAVTRGAPVVESPCSTSLGR